MNKNNKIINVLLIISLIGVVGLSIGIIILKNKSNNIVLEKEEIIDEKVGNKIEFDDVKKKLLNWVLGLKTIQDKFNDVLNIIKKEQFDKKEEENKFKILKDEFLKVLGEYIDVILRSEENKENKYEYFQIINEFKKLITVEFLKEKIGHKKFEDEGSKPTGIFKKSEEEKEEIFNLFIQYFENLKNEEKKYFLSSKKEGKENEFAKSGISKKFKDIFSWFKEPKSFNNNFSQMENIEQIKLIGDESDSETTDDSKKIILIKENKEKKQYIVNGILLTGENIELSETDEQFLERKVKYEFIKYFENNIKKMTKFNLINNFIQNKKFNDKLIEKMFHINEENKYKKDGSSFEFKFDEKEIFKNKIFVKVLNEFDKDKNNVKKIKRIIEIIKAEVKEKINFDVFLNVDISDLSSDIIETQEVIDLLKQIQKRNKSEKNTIGFTGQRGEKGPTGPQGKQGPKGEMVGINEFRKLFYDENTQGTLGRKLKELEANNIIFDSKIDIAQIEAKKFKESFDDENTPGTLGKKLKDLENRKYKINLKASRLKLLLNRKILNKTETQIAKIDLSLKINRSFIIIYKQPQHLNSDGVWTLPVYTILNNKICVFGNICENYYKHEILNFKDLNKALVDKYLEKIYNGTPNENILKLIKT